MKACAKVFGIMAAMALALALGACGGGGEAASDQGSPDQAGQAGQSGSAIAGTWDFTSITLADGTSLTIKEFADMNNADVSLLQTTYVFMDDGTLTMSNMQTGLIEGTWELNGDTVSVTASYQGETINVDLQLEQGPYGDMVMTQANADGSVSVVTKVS